MGCHLTPIHLGNGLRSGLINPLLAGLSIVCLPESDLDAFFASIEEFRPTCLNASFALLRAILRRAPEYRHALRQNRFRFVRSGAALHPEEIDRLEDALGAPVLVGFSSVETTAISHDPLPPRQRKREAAGLPLLNQVAVINDSGRICAKQVTGQLVVRGPLVFPGDPGRSRAYRRVIFRRVVSHGRLGEPSTTRGISMSLAALRRLSIGVARRFRRSRSTPPSSRCQA